MEYALLAILPLVLLFFSTQGHNLGAYTSTVVHEAGHALGSLTTGGDVHKIVVNPDTSGYTSTSRAVTLKGKFTGIITTASGYIMPPLFATILLVCVWKEETQLALMILSSVGLISLVFSRGMIATLSSLAIVIPSGYLTYAMMTEKTSILFDTQTFALINILAFTGIFWIEGVRSVKTVRDIAIARKKGTLNAAHNQDSIPDTLALATQVPLTTEMFWVRFFEFTLTVLGVISVVSFGVTCLTLFPG